MVGGELKRAVRGVLERSNAGYRWLLKHDYGTSGPYGSPALQRANAVLRSAREVDESIAEVRRLGLPPVGDRPKHWDSLAALDVILRTTDKSARVFDAGGELYSMLLPWLFLYGYRNLIAGNLVFRHKRRRGPIVYEYADITRTAFAPGTFDAVACLSVIEHGVDLEAYFREMARIVKDGGLLITSTDYYETQIDTGGRMAFGAPIHVFTREEILHALRIAEDCGFELQEPLDLTSPAKVVHWAEHDLQYTFLLFCLRKRPSWTS